MFYPGNIYSAFVSPCFRACVTVTVPHRGFRHSFCWMFHAAHCMLLHLPFLPETFFNVLGTHRGPTDRVQHVKKHSMMCQVDTIEFLCEKHSLTKLLMQQQQPRHSTNQNNQKQTAIYRRPSPSNDAHAQAISILQHRQSSSHNHFASRPHH